MRALETRALADFLRKHSSTGGCTVLTGAGCSTESGIPDYRGPHGQYRRPDFVPLMFQRFMREDNEKRRYWARSMLGYSAMSGASCNPTHMGLYTLAQAGVVGHILTQNVDGLHHLAAYGGIGDDSESGFAKYTSSSSPVTEVHGNIHLVVCMQCGHVIPRVHLQRQLREANQELYDGYAADRTRMRPDGDYSAPAHVIEGMRLVGCEKCGGPLKPHVVLFGENVSRPVVERTSEIVKASSSLVCLGTSLQVYSAYRYILMAKEAGVPVAIVNSGKTRGDGMEDLKVDTDSTASVIEATVDVLLGEHVDLSNHPIGSGPERLER